MRANIAGTICMRTLQFYLHVEIIVYINNFRFPAWEKGTNLGYLAVAFHFAWKSLNKLIYGHLLVVHNSEYTVVVIYNRSWRVPLLASWFASQFVFAPGALVMRSPGWSAAPLLSRPCLWRSPARFCTLPTPSPALALPRQLHGLPQRLWVVQAGTVPSESRRSLLLGRLSCRICVAGAERTCPWQSGSVSSGQCTLGSVRRRRKLGVSCREGNLSSGLRSQQSPRPKNNAHFNK